MTQLAYPKTTKDNKIQMFLSKKKLNDALKLELKIWQENNTQSFLGERDKVPKNVS